MYLVPGSSAMGYRLPLDALPWIAPGERNPGFDRCQFEPRPPLPATAAEQMRQRPQLRADRGNGTTSPAAGSPPGQPMPEALAPPGGVVRTALCVEPRDGHLYVFLPPL